ncbi:uncharacterized protein LOC111240775 [Vigna radiata var. radiata]|uniref:Uncharacterized protein LOC111240775 n=1 Tax=Vigna radiata var. radiata TaxID=3916 RepID=A0A3Q0EM96_VIGRR|nr:uncharacterized protein LOC111240775 [Vigna radiata var. radiata]
MDTREIRWGKDLALEIMGWDREAAFIIRDKSFRLCIEGRAAITVELCEMKKVHLQDLPNLRSFSSGETLKWSSLDNVVLKDCPKVKKFGLGMIKESELKSILITENEEQSDPQTKLPYLFELLDDKLSLITDYTVSNNEELYEILNNLQSSHFTNLQILRVNNYRGDMLDHFLIMLWIRSHKLQVINIQDCSLFCFCSNRQRVEGGKIFTQLKELKLIKVQLRHIWSNDDPEFLDLGNLQILHIIDVSFLRHIFYRYPTEKLHQLKELIIEKCEALYTVFMDDHFTRGGPRTNFLSLSKLEFKSLPRLTQIYSGHLEFPSLKYLVIETCPLLTKFTTGFADSHEMFTTDGESFFELNEIVFDSYDNMVCVISSKTLQELMNLEKLFVSHCKELKIIFNIHQEIPSSTQLLQQLSELALIHLPKLTCIVNKQISKIYQNLKILRVKQCKSLHLLQVPLKLTNLEISDCEALENIILIKEEEEERREKLSFHVLKDISLENLSKLFVVFPSTSEFPSLQTLKIANCSALRSFVEDPKSLTESSTTNYFFPSSVLDLKSPIRQSGSVYVILVIRATSLINQFVESSNNL